MNTTEAVVGVGVARVPRQRGERVARDMLQVADKVVKLLKSAVRGAPPGWKPDKDFREMFDTAMAAVTKLPTVLAQVREEVQRFTAELDTDEIERYAAAELAFRVTRQMSDDQVIALLATRYGGDLAQQIEVLIRATRHERMKEARAGNKKNNRPPGVEADEWEAG